MEDIIKLPQYYVLLDSDNRICMITTNKQNENQFLFEFPSDFNVGDMINYKIIKNELIYDEYIYPPVDPVPTLEERVSNTEVSIVDIEDAMCDTELLTDERITALEDAICELSMAMEV